MGGDGGPPAGHAGGTDGRLVVGDPLRAIAAVSVVVFHAAVAVTLASGTAALGAFGEAGRLLFSLDTGLVVFFVLSGYLLTRPFARALVRGEPIATTGYLRRRLARVLPAYFALVAATLLVEGRQGAPLTEVLTLATLTQAWSQTDIEMLLYQGWTLSVELAFYLALPVAALAAAVVARRLPSPSARAWTMVAAIVGVALASYALLRTLDGVDDRQLPPAHLWAFAPGILLALVEPLGLGGRLPRWTPSALLTAALAAGVMLLAVSKLRDDVRAPLTAVVAGAPLAAALVLQWQGRRPWRVLDNRPMHWLGTRSYGIYLWHSLMMFQFLPLAEGETAWTAFALLTATALPATIVCAALSWRFIEQPAIAWARGRRRAAPGATRHAPALTLQPSAASSPTAP